MKKTKRRIEVIYVHCTATAPGKEVSVETIRQWHLARGFSDIGYHYIVQPDGRIDLGRDIDIPGAHVKGDNKYSIGVSMVGLWDNDTMPDPKGAQEMAAAQLIAELCKMYDIVPKSYRLLLHREAHLHRPGVPNPHKSCPGMNIEGRLMRLYVNSFYEKL
jgi:N-acetyl-anhydromuramyl-L-alanine amidase AmpD